MAGNPNDADQFAWFFRYDATAIAHGRLPALVTTALNAPTGINVMWNTFMLLPGVLLAPLTLLAGPQASLTLLMTVGFAGSAFAPVRRAAAVGRAAAVRRDRRARSTASPPPCCTPRVGHYDLMFAVLPPLIVDAAAADRGTGRWARRRAARRAGAGRCWPPPSCSPPRNCCSTRPWPRR